MEPSTVAPLETVEDRRRIASISPVNVFASGTDSGYMWEANGSWWPYRAQRYFDVDMDDGSHNRGTRYRSFRYLVDTDMLGHWMPPTDLQAIADGIEPTHILLRQPSIFDKRDLLTEIDWGDYHGTVILPLDSYDLSLHALEQADIGPAIQAVGVSKGGRSPEEFASRLRTVNEETSYGTEIYVIDTDPVQATVKELARVTEAFDAFILPCRPPFTESRLEATVGIEPEQHDTTRSAFGEEFLVDTADAVTTLAGELAYLFSPLSPHVSDELLAQSAVPESVPRTHPSEHDGYCTPHTVEDFEDLPAYITDPL
jgi:hypothetical protein